MLRFHGSHEGDVPTPHSDADSGRHVALAVQRFHGVVGNVGIDPVLRQPDFELIRDTLDAIQIPDHALRRQLRGVRGHIPAEGGDAVVHEDANHRGVHLGRPDELSQYSVANRLVGARHCGHHGSLLFHRICW
jgi:hypothetical protein